VAAVTGVTAAEEVDTVVEEVDTVAPHEVVAPSTGTATATPTLLVPARVLVQVLSSTECTPLALQTLAPSVSFSALRKPPAASTS